ncbi:MAG: DUF5399 family protein [Candidatus Melainabacteria bacterium]|nr:DUF5399 family protein [Candidatus Melainabacteria bacterium]
MQQVALEKEMKGVTIDKLDIKEHVRWAQDQIDLDIAFVKESNMVGSQSEIMGTSLIYSSKLEELFELQKRNLPWACFAPPVNFQMFGKRFFSYRLFPSIHWEDEKEQDDEKKEEKNPSDDLVQNVMKVTKDDFDPGFEEDKSCMLGLLEEIKWINELLKQINARKLQYQKG